LVYLGKKILEEVWGVIMNCKTCGFQLKDGARFCSNCGQVVEFRPVSQNIYSVNGLQKRRVSKVTLLMSGICLVLAAALAVALLIPREPNIAGVRLTDRVFSTPKEAVSYFVDGARTCDLQKMSEAFGIEKLSNGYDFTNYSNRLKVIMPNFLMPDKYNQFTSINRLQLLGQCIASYKTVLFGLNGIDYSKTITKADDASIEEYVKRINPDSLKNIKLSKFEDFSMADDPKHLENMKRSAASYDADEAKVFTVELDCNVNKVSCDTLSMYRYGSSWYIGNAIFNME
jgi:hypothetical protein